jgi:hypothetical protein
VSTDQVLAWRQHRQLLTARDGADAAAVVARCGGIQSQVASAADLSVAVRRAQPGRGETEAALWETRTIVRTWALRGTLHLLPSAEIGLWLGALRGRRGWERPSWQRAFGVTAAEIETLIEAIGVCLDGDPLTRQELAVAVEGYLGHGRLGHRLVESWGALLKPAAYQGRLIQGPPRGRSVTFTRPDRWLRAIDVVGTREAELELTRRFLSAHGPATAGECARWWGLGPGQGRALLAALEEETVTVEIDGRRSEMLRADLAELRETAPSHAVRLLPLFDVYTITALPLPGAVPARHVPAVSRTAGWISAVVTVGGRVAGVWEATMRRGRAEIDVRLFRGAPRPPRAELRREGERIAAYLGGPLDLRVSSG